MNMLAMLKDQCKKNGINTLLTFAPDGSAILFIDVKELDPMGVCLKAAMDVEMKRAAMGLQTSNAKFNVVKNKLVTAPDCAYSWRVADEHGNEIASGYAATEAEAQEKMRPYLE